MEAALHGRQPTVGRERLDRLDAAAFDRRGER